MSSFNPNATQLGTPPGSVGAAFLTYTDPSGAAQSITFDVVESEDWNEGADITEHSVEQGANIADHVRVRVPEVSLEVFVTNEPAVSNQFADPQLKSLALPVGAPVFVPATGALAVTSWESSLDLRTTAAMLVGLGAGAIAGAVGAGTAGFPASAIASVIAGDLLSLTLPGSQSVATIQTDAGLQPSAVATTLQAQTYQFANPQDFVEAMHALLVQLKNAATTFFVFGTKEIQPNMVIEELSFHRGSDTGTGERIRIGLKQIRVVATQTVTAPIPNLPGGGGIPPQKRGGQDPLGGKSVDFGSVAKSLVTAAGNNPVAALASVFGLSVGQAVPGLH